MSDWIAYSLALVRAELRFPGTSIRAALDDAISGGVIRRRAAPVANLPLDFVPVLNPSLNTYVHGETTQSELLASDLEQWLSSLSHSGPAKTSRPLIDRSLARSDAALVEEMHVLLSSGKEQSPHACALLFVNRAVGGGSTESKQRRLAKRYREVYPLAM